VVKRERACRGVYGETSRNGIALIVHGSCLGLFCYPTQLSQGRGLFPPCSFRSNRARIRHRAAHHGYRPTRCGWRVVHTAASCHGYAQPRRREPGSGSGARHVPDRQRRTPITLQQGAGNCCTWIIGRRVLQHVRAAGTGRYLRTGGGLAGVAWVAAPPFMYSRALPMHAGHMRALARAWLSGFICLRTRGFEGGRGREREDKKLRMIASTVAPLIVVYHLCTHHRQGCYYYYYRATPVTKQPPCPPPSALVLLALLQTVSRPSPPTPYPAA